MFIRKNPELDTFERDCGIIFEGALDYLKPEWKRDFNLAMGSSEWKQAARMYGMDAQPTLITTPNAGIPAFLTTFIDPDILRVLTAKNAMVEILGERRKGDWVDMTAQFPVIEHTGEVSSYGDYANSGVAGGNVNWEVRESYLYQNTIQYGDLELERAARARIGWASELKQAAIAILLKFQNLTYVYGVNGLQNYGLFNAPQLQAPIAPAPKAAGGITWFNGTTPNAVASEVYSDILSLVTLLFSQSSGNIDADSPFVLALSPKSSSALNFTNQYNVNVKDQLKKNYPNLRVETAVQYGVLSAQNPQGVTGGEFMQLICEKVEGQETGFCAFSEKLRAGSIIKDMSAYRQKMVQGTWGTVLRQPFAVAAMIGM